MTRPTLNHLHAPGDKFVREFVHFANQHAGGIVPQLPRGYSIESVARCALARFRSGAEYEERVTEYIDAVVAAMTGTA